MSLAPAGVAARSPVPVSTAARTRTITLFTALTDFPLSITVSSIKTGGAGADVEIPCTLGDEAALLQQQLPVRVPRQAHVDVLLVHDEQRQAPLPQAG